MGTLRFLLALCVVVTHAPGKELFGVKWIYGATAVQGFYIVSGFLITLVLNTRAEYREISRFYISRYLRLWPAYIVVATMSFVMFKSDLLIHSIAKMDWPVALFVIASNATIFLQDLFLFFAITPDGASLYPTAHFIAEPGMKFYELLLVPQSWSLGIELTFYLIAPFICRSPARLFALFCFGIIVRIGLGLWSPEIDPWIYRFSPAEMMLFASGGLVYFAGTWLERRVPALIMRAVGVVCLAILATIIISLHDRVRTLSQSLFLLNWNVLAMIAISCPFLLVASRGLRWESMIGELSYPMYLSHLLVYDAMVTFVPYTLTSSNFSYVCATILFSAALLWLVVLPVDRFRTKFGARMPADQNAALVPATTPAHAKFMKFPAE
jgi:peptidoglycan/LPS O-acetylase OafA/YrhL